MTSQIEVTQHTVSGLEVFIVTILAIFLIMSLIRTVIEIDEHIDYLTDKSMGSAIVDSIFRAFLESIAFDKVNKDTINNSCLRPSLKVIAIVLVSIILVLWNIFTYIFLFIALLVTFACIGLNVTIILPVLAILKFILCGNKDK